MKQRRKLRREGWDEATIREQVDAVIQSAAAGEYANFDQFFDALLLANDNLPHTVLAEELTGANGQPVTAQTIRALREGEHLPTYPLIEQLLEHNLLNLDPAQIGAGGTQRALMFEMAGMQEVTPETLAAHNAATLEQHRHDGTLEVHFGTLMSEIIGFQTQADRAFLKDIPGFADDHRCRDILANTGVPNEEERQALYDYAKLTPAQQDEIESAVRGQTIKFGRPDQRTPFAKALDEVLDQIKTQGLRAQDVCENSKDADGKAIAQSELSQLRHGKYPPTADKLRAILRGIDWCNARMLTPISEQQKAELVAASPVPDWRLHATSHDCIARADSNTSIKELLLQIREAVDINVQRPVVIKLNNTPHSGGVHINSQGMLLNWETEGYQVPEPKMVEGLLKRYDHLLQQNGHEPLSQSDHAKVLSIAERDYGTWLNTPHKDKVRLTARTQENGSSMVNNSF